MNRLRRTASGFLCTLQQVSEFPERQGIQAEFREFSEPKSLNSAEFPDAREFREAL
jgi:hypothetical protein